MTCPECGGPMKERTNRSTGEIFWGCLDFPDCRGTRPADGDEPTDEDGAELPSERFQARDRRRYRDG